MSNKIVRSSKIIEVRLGDMAVSELAQRALKQNRVDELVANFDPDRLGTPVVNKRDGRHYIIDGQHRIKALIQWLGTGWEQQPIACQVFSGMTEKQEAEMFLRLNNVLRVDAFEKFDKSVVAGRKEETIIKRIVEQEGLALSRRKQKGIHSVTTLLRILKRTNNIAVLGRTLRVIRDAYGDMGFESVVLDGVAMVCSRYHDTLDEKRLIERLGAARGGVKGLINRANEIQLRVGGSKGSAVAAAVVDTHNAASRANRLPSWWTIE